ncbi:hypothetical protein COU18_02965 [Candidatus Kaiserbacteria bacterium CG10_big_fil_rev_8_21_14_0_10_51_14]|uniref:Membrane fusion protein biotin-lipoyl like domain-containing protein n=1 Tax=Candidatus Kaiserbacteria bacterium CG10_big_fil_rev_8_21_14_0_10_51_14 TaxID=1974610 RepID=A0A2H0UB28_9BACT|nr:MAG: hypothetical protein COU18_02965 [Candidatus Kaiserbacteria bacterium CG10_big_fil_rev_8_21_14_0_10_51_14]
MTLPPFLTKAILYVRTQASLRIAWFRALSRRRKMILVIAAVATLALIIFLILNSGHKEASAEPHLRTIEQIMVGDYGTSGAVGIAVPTAHSGTFVVRAEAGGRVTRVVSSGNRVAQGAVVAELENSAQRAALVQAQGVYEAAEANLSKVSGGSRSEQRAILEAQVTSATAALDASRSGAVNTILSAYATADSAIYGTIDKMFENPGKTSAKFTILTSDSQLTNSLENTRVAIEENLLREATMSGTLTSSSNLYEELQVAQIEIRTIRNFTDMVIAALNKAISSSSVSETTIATYLAEATAARTSLTTSLTSLSAAVQGLASSQSALDVARKNLEQGIVGGQTEDVAAARASLKQAQGGLAAAQASYGKTLVRVPFSGTITSLSVAVGDIISVGSDVALVVPDEGVPTEASFALPLSAVKFTPAGAYVFMVDESNTLQSVAVRTGLVTTNAIMTTGLSGTELIVKDVRGLKAGERVALQ